MSGRPIYFPGLNGIRAIAAISVVLSHITLALGDFHLNPHLLGTLEDGSPKGISLAGYGVSIFFVLSGFLITYLLQEEKEIDIKKFYHRRILRIWPLYYLYLFIAFLVIFIYGLNLNFNSIFFYLFFAANVPFILGTFPYLLSHYWSIGVEEQFYIFWPWINKYFKSLILPILTIIILLIATKSILHILYPNSLLESIIHVTRFHCMMIGALGAILYKNNNETFIKIANHKLIQLISWGIIFLAAINKYHIASFIDNEIIAVFALFIIIGQIKIQNRIINLEIPVMDFLGKISYGIYVFHPLVIFLYSKALDNANIDSTAKYFVVYGLITATTILLAHLSYTYFEKYFLKAKKKYEVVQSASSKYLAS